MSKNFKKQSEKTLKAQAAKFEARGYQPREDEVCFEHCIVMVVKPGAKFEVETPQKTKIQCQLSGKMYQNKINVMESDIVTVVTSPYNLTVGRIVLREHK